MSGIIINPYSFATGSAFSSTKSLDFDGVDDYIDCGNDSSLDLTTLSISIWAKFDYLSGNKILIGKNHTSSYYLNSAGGTLSWWTDGSSLSTVDINIDDGNWHHILCTASASSKDIYVDGVLKVSGAGVLATTDTNNLRIGDSGNLSNPFQGNIDEVSLFNSVKAIGDLWDGTGKPTDLTGESGLVAWYRMGENSTFSSPQILMPENTNKDKVSNYSMDFDGVNDYIQVPNSTDLDFGTGDFTWSLWVNYKTFGNYDGLLFTGATNSQYRLKFQTSGQLLNLQNADGDSQVADLGTNIAGTGWHHLCLIRSSGTITTFLDGSAVDTDVRAGNVNSGGNDLIIGDNGGAFFTGNIDEVSMFNSAKAIGDIWDGTGRPTDLTGESGLVGYWKMGEEAVFNSTNWLLPNKAQDVFSRYSMAFDGVGDSVNCGDLSAYDNGDFTFSCWIYKTTSALEYVWSTGGSSGNAGFAIAISGSETLSIARKTRTIDCMTGWQDMGFTLNNWHNIACIYTDSTNTMECYVDGVLKYTKVGAASTNSASLDLIIGSTSPAGSYDFTGKMDEFSIFNSVKAIGDIWDGSGKPTDLTGQSGLVSWWRMGEDATFSTNWTIPDKIGSNTGTSANMTNDDLTGDAPGVTGNGVSANMTIEDRTGDAPDSSNNALSYNMVEADIEEEAP